MEDPDVIPMTPPEPRDDSIRRACLEVNVNRLPERARGAAAALLRANSAEFGFFWPRLHRPEEVQ